jgi:CrcB protein
MSQMLDLGAYLLWVALGSAFGGVARVALSARVAHTLRADFPWGSLCVNASGALAIGVLAAVLDAGLLGGWSGLWPLLVVGFLGSYTTVSSFSLQTLALVHAGRRLRAGANVLLTLALCLGGVAAGYMAAGAVLAVRVA